jgi:hypothetical protein
MATGTDAPRLGLSCRQRATQGHACGQRKRHQRQPLDFSVTHL